MARRRHSPLEPKDISDTPEYIIKASDVGLDDILLNRLAKASNLRKELADIIEEWIEATADAKFAQWVRGNRRRLDEALAVREAKKRSNGNGNGLRHSARTVASKESLDLEGVDLVDPKPPLRAAHRRNGHPHPVGKF